MFFFLLFRQDSHIQHTSQNLYTLLISLLFSNVFSTLTFHMW